MQLFFSHALKKSVFTIFFLIYSLFTYSQKVQNQANKNARNSNNTLSAVACNLFSDSNNYTTSNQFSFLAPVNNNSGFVGPSNSNYGCMGSVPNQVWFVVTITAPGNLHFRFYNTTGIDVDAVLWPKIPNNDLVNACSVTSSNPLSCDYDASTPDLYIPNAQVGDKYLMLVTNYSGRSSTITVGQPTGGTVSYSMLNLPYCSQTPSATISGSNSIIPEGDPINLTLDFTGNAPYNYVLSDGSYGKSETSQEIVTVYPTAASTVYTISSVSNACGTGSGTGSVGVSTIRNVELKSCLPLNGNLIDEKGINSGYSDFITPTENRFGESLNAANFNGVSSYGVLTANQLNNVTFTYAIWAKTDPSINVSRNETMILSSGGSSDTHFLSVVKSEGANFWKFSSNGSSVQSIKEADDNWHLLVGVRRGGELELFVDGVSQGKVPCSLTTYEPNNVLRIGSGFDGSNFKGVLDDIKIYRSSLIEPEILLLQDFTSCNNVADESYLAIQSINNGVICNNSSLIIRAITNNLPIENYLQFTAELSDINGDFFNPTILGSSSFVPLNVVIPSNIIEGNYKLRVKYGGYTSVNEYPIYINNAGTVSITTTSEINEGETAYLHLDFTGTGPWTYKLLGGLDQVSNTNSLNIPVVPTQTTVYQLSAAKNVCGNLSFLNVKDTVEVKYTKELISCFPFSGNSNDQLGKNSSTVNGAFLTENRYGQANQSFSFVGNSSNIHFTTNGLKNREYTMSAWVKLNALPTSEQVILSMGSSTIANQSQSILVDQYGWKFSSYSDNNGNITILNSNVGFVTNSWVHLAVVRTYGELYFYINGQRVQKGNNSRNIPQSSFEVGRIGSHPYYSNKGFIGSIDDVRLYKGALNQDEVFALFDDLTNCPEVEYKPTLITRSVNKTSYCAGSNLEVTFSYSNYIPSENYPFEVQLSDQNGSFANALTIGSGMESPITASLPYGIQGSNYRVRVKSIYPSNIKIGNSIKINISGERVRATMTAPDSINTGESAQIIINFTGTAPWNYVFNQSNWKTLSGPDTVTVTPYRTQNYEITGLYSSCGPGAETEAISIRVPSIIEFTSNRNGTNCGGKSDLAYFRSNFTPINGYKIQLSDKNGNFDKALIIGTGSVSPINITFPDTCTFSNNYKIRAISFDSTVIGPASMAFSIKEPAVAIISGSGNVDLNSSATISISFSGTPPYFYNYTNSNSVSDFETYQRNVNITVFPTENTDYHVTYLRNECGLGTFSGTASLSVASSISINNINSSYCMGQQINLSFETNIVSSSTFKVELSNSEGVFENPTILATGNSNPINVTIPSTLNEGAGYKLRIVTSDGYLTSNISNSFSINKKVQAKLSGSIRSYQGNGHPFILEFTGTAPFKYSAHGMTSGETSLNRIELNSQYEYILDSTSVEVSNICGLGEVSGSSPINVIGSSITSLISCYSFTNSFESHNNIYNLIGSNISFTTDRSGRLASAINLNGNSYVQNSTYILNSTIPSNTWSFWIKPTSSFSSKVRLLNIDGQSMYLKGGGSTSYTLQFNIDASEIPPHNWDDIQYLETPEVEAVDITMNQWSNIIVTRNGGQTEIFVNGISIGNYNLEVNQRGNGIFIGGKPTDLSKFIGSIDDIQIYDGNLSPYEVSQQYLNSDDCKSYKDISILKINNPSGISSCIGGSFNITYETLNDLLYTENLLIFELSDSVGSFANPVLLGSTLTAAGTKDLSLPSDILPSSGYKVRLKTNNNVSSSQLSLSIKTPVRGVLTGGGTIDEGGNTTINISFNGAEPPFNYKINNEPSFITYSQSIEYIVSPDTTTTYEISNLINSCGAGTWEGSAIITVLPKPLRLISCFPFSGTFEDDNFKSRSDNFGPTFTSNKYNIPNEAISFDGAFDYQIILPNSLYADNFSIAMRFSVKGEKKPGFPNTYLLYQIGHGPDLSKQHLIYLDYTPDMGFGPEKYMLKIRANNQNAEVELSNFRWGEWYDLAVVKTPQDYKLYLDGKLKFTVTGVIANITFDPYSPIYLGRYLNSLGQDASFYGKIDQFQMYKGALTNGQIDALSKSSFDCFDASNFVCVNDQSFTSNISGHEVIKAGNAITADKTIINGSNILFDSKNSILLLPGFKTETNTVFQATVGGGCLD